MFLASVKLLTVFCVVHVQSNYTKEWVVRVTGGSKEAEVLAAELGYHFRGPVRGFENTYLLVKMDVMEQHKRGMHYVTRKLETDHRVVWADEQEVKRRVKRDYIMDDGDCEDKTFNDQLWPQEWYLHDTRKEVSLPKLDLNVLPVYKMGFTGKGIRVSILDDGIEYTHEDLIDNYDPAISWDCNHDDPDPLPTYGNDKKNAHGTRCAGEVAMVANNGKCGVGIAFNARIGGVKLLDGFVNDRIEGIALSFAQHLVDIYSASWGPTDDGRTVDGPGRLAQEAFIRGTTKGREGKGAIFIWASGNGGIKDNCNCDGYISSPYTISIGSASQSGSFPWYGEICASTLAVTYSSGAYNDQKIVTTDLRNQCTVKHTGTSASAPLAAGIVALALEANGNLTWRDIQHLIVWTSEYEPVQQNKGWQINAAGLWINTRFGFGLMNAHHLVQRAIHWHNVPDWSQCTITNNNHAGSYFKHGEPITISFPSTGCQDLPNEVNIIEQVQVEININYTERGALEMYLTSPQNTRVQLLTPRFMDKSPGVFYNWRLLSVLHWGEFARGTWLIHIIDKAGDHSNYGYLDEFKLILYGTAELPEHMRLYDVFNSFY